MPGGFCQIQREAIQRLRAALIHNKNVFHVGWPQPAAEVQAVDTDDHAFFHGETFFRAM